jgi:hypothetical protein
VKARLWIDDQEVVLNGYLVFEELQFKITLDSLKAAPITFFDFSRRLGESYSFPIKIGKHKKKFKMRLEEIVATSYSNKVHQFRLIGGFETPELKCDLVFFADMKRGVIGSYISAFEENTEIVIAPRGNILRDSLDYSKKQFKIFQ